MSFSMPPSDDNYSRYAASSPMPYAADDTPSDPSVRTMRLKVLYTHDDKSNCMARWHRVVHVRTAFLDERTEIGVVELKTCIKALVNSSPELVATLGQDYTVYAYDYSEYEVPLVGQGMLSWVLASASKTLTGQAGQSQTMVTGRVTRNPKSLFGQDPGADMLEVKLRLVPVPTVSQSEYIESMKRYRDISRVMPESFDPQGWTEFLKANPQVLATIGPRNGSPSQNSTSAAHMGIEHVQRLMQAGNASFSSRPSMSQSRRGSFAGSVASQDQSRIGSPTPSTHSRLGGSLMMPQIQRPGSSVSHRSLSRNTSFEVRNDAEDDERQDDAPPRKRARITQVRRPGRNQSFGKQVDSLRVAASTAASVRVFQPTAVRPGAGPTGIVEEPPRAPTPIPQFARGPRRVAPQARSGLGRSTTMPSSDHDPFHNTIKVLESAMTSPENGCALESSPGEDPGSSPPLPPSRGVSAAPSSPELPRMPPHEDSGFMSGTIDEVYDGKGQMPNQSIEDDAPAVEAHLQAHLMSDARRTQGTRPLPSKPASERAGNNFVGAPSEAERRAAEQKAVEVSRRNARHAASWRRVQSWSEGQPPTSDPSSEMPPPDLRRCQTSEAGDRPRSKHAYDRKKQATNMQRRLQGALESGDRPPFCENCGDIRTPTWRKAFVKSYAGSPKGVHVSKELGGILAIQTEKMDQDGTITQFRVVKKSLLETDEDFSDLLLCNSCGLWLANRGQMRPPDKWQSNKCKKTKLGSEPRSGGGAKRQRSTARDRSATAAPSDMSEPPSEAVLPAFESQYPATDILIDPQLTKCGTAMPEPDNEPELPTLPQQPQQSRGMNGNRSRSDTVMPTGAATAALRRETQSSPGEIGGSKRSPITIDDTATPDRTRRTLFPSPKTFGPLGTSTGNVSKHSSLNNSPDLPKQGKRATLPASALQNTTADKENQQPGRRDLTPTPDKERDDMFDLFNSPSTPSRTNGITLPKPKSPCDLFKTPRKPTPRKASGGGPGTGHGPASGDFFSSAAKAFLHPPRTPTRTPSKQGKVFATPGTETPFTRHVNALLSEQPDVFDFGPATSPGRLFAEIPGFGDLPTTDLPMPSSPPVGTGFLGMGMGVDAAERKCDWSELGLGSSPFKTSAAREEGDSTMEEAVGRGKGQRRIVT